MNLSTIFYAGGITLQKQKLVLVGNGMAGVRCIEEILKNDPYAFEITIFGSEPHTNYNRILLSKVLQGGTSIGDITINDRSWYEERNIQLHTGETVVKIHSDKQVLETDKNRTVSYDKLILATGSVPFFLPLPGASKDGVIAFRTIEDCQKMIKTSRSYKKAVVIGGGLLGLEAARGLLNLGMKVNVVHIASYLMERQLDPAASKLLQKELECQGMNFLLEKQTEEIIGNSRVQGLRFKDGTEVEADLVVMAVGVKPNVTLAEESGIETNRAILVNDYLETYTSNIYAVGECAEHRDMVYGLVKPLYEQGKILAKRICGIDCDGYKGSVLSTQLKISGIDVFSAGQFSGDETTKSLTLFNELDGVYKKLVFKDDKMIGAVIFGDKRDSQRLLELIVQKKNITNIEKTALLHPSNEASHSVASMAQSEIICNCNSVSKGAIIEAIQKEGLTTVEQVKKCTKASGSCGSCKPLVKELLAYIQSNEFDDVIEQKPICSCTALTDEEVVQEIQLQGLTSVQEVMDTLGWENKQGCSTCIPAMQYYLGMIYPEYVHKDETLFINGKMNAINQSDGRYSVVQNIITCAGDHMCRCDKQSSLKLAVILEKSTQYLQTPYRVKIGITACMHDGAGSTTKDIDVIGIARGWEIYVGGSSRRNVRAGELLCVAENDQDAIDIISGLIQYYRETANYLERTWQWIQRVGLIHVREVLFDRELCQQLLERLEVDTSKYTKISEKSSIIKL
jgi:nitrite reductase (NADH) large subunit